LSLGASEQGVRRRRLPWRMAEWLGEAVAVGARARRAQGAFIGIVRG
jgi:hypothetical protein